ncbi:MAG TPA: amino acid adenylation domain-containing protein, partial [Longimicrobiaceae bacterium]
LRGRLDAAALRRAWEKVVERRPVLRTVFAWEGMDRPLQLVRRAAPLPWEALDWRGSPRAAQRERLEAYLEAQRERDFDLLRAPLMRLGLAQLADDRFELVWTYHHLLLDGWSLSLVLQDVFTAYEAILQGREPALPRRRPFRDHVARLQRQDLAAAEAFWRDALAGLTAPTPLGVDRAGEGAPDDGAPFDRVEHRLSPQATSSLRSLARQSRVTLNTVVQGAWALLLSRYSGEDEVVFGVTASGRPPELQSVDEMVGLFINTLPLRLRVEPRAGVEEWLGRLQARQVESRAHEQAPLSRVHAWSEVPAELPLFESILVFENHPIFTPVGGGENGFEVEGWRELGRSHYPLALIVLPDEELDLYLEYDRRRIGAGAAGRMVRHLETVLEGLAVPGRKLAEVPLLTRAERARVLEEWNPAPAETPRACVHELFRAQAERTPEAAALVSAGGTLTFRELDRGSHRLAHRLRAHGVGPETVVAVLAEHSAEVVTALLAVLGAGGVYLPLDPGAPPERLAYVLGDARAALVLAQPGLEGRLPSGGPRVLPLDPSRDDAAPLPPLPPFAFADSAAYLVYTSGSTGLPKGVVVPHGAAAAHLGAVARAYGHTPADRVLAFASLTFDQSLEDLLAPLVAGASVVVRDPEVWTPAELAERVRALGVTAMNLPTAYWSQLVRDPAAVAGLKACLRLMIVGGEALQPATVRAWEEGPGGPVALVNGYGPTEAVVTATLFEVPAGRAGAWTAAVPIGRPVGGRTAYVLDASGEPAPVGVPGELCIGGAELARGYLGRPELTAERFVPDPFGRVPGGRVYRTGDRARWLEAGELEFLGRVDQQVKVRGYRIEPGEVEAALLADGRVREAAVVAREDAPGEVRLVAYAAPAEGAALTGAELRAGLRERLPEYMVPSAFVLLERLPLNANGKTDRRALPAPDAAGAGEYSEPQTGTERMLAAVWAEVLRVERVGTHDGFFALGGHSLLAMQIISRVRREAGVEVPLRTLFEAPTLGALAARVDALGAGRPEGGAPIGRTSRDGPFPLSFAQQRLWLVDRLEPGSAAYNMPHALRLRGALDVDALRASLGALVERHETLRTVFAEAGGEPVQVIHADAPVALEVVEVAGEEEVERLAEEEALRPFDLARGPLLRSTLLRLGEEDHVLLFTLHHIVSDGWSMDVLVREVSALYAASVRGGSAELPELPVRYVDYAVWQRERLAGPVLEEQLGWWKARLAGAPPLLELPTDRPRAAGTGARAGSVPFTLPRKTAEAVRELSRRQGATPFMTVLAAWQALLGRHAGQDDVVVGSPVAGRTRVELEGLIGFFVNML